MYYPFSALIQPLSAVKNMPHQTVKLPMSILGMINFDLILLSAMVTIATREILIILLPDHIAGPDGWLIQIKSKT